MKVDTELKLETEVLNCDGNGDGWAFELQDYGFSLRKDRRGCKMDEASSYVQIIFPI